MKVKKRKCVVSNYSLIFFDRDLTCIFLFDYSNNASTNESATLANSLVNNRLDGNNRWNSNASGVLYSMSDIIEHFTMLFDAIVSYCHDDFFKCESTFFILIDFFKSLIIGCIYIGVLQIFFREVFCFVDLLRISEQGMDVFYFFNMRLIMQVI